MIPIREPSDTEREPREGKRTEREREGGETREKHAHVRVYTKSPVRPSQVANPGTHMYGPKHAETDEGSEKTEKQRRSAKGM